MTIQAQKGTKDILPGDSQKWQFMEETAKEVFSNANYQEIRTPIFEATELFSRGVGTTTDIVNKEMYTFIQKERSITLRPENTAGVVRAFIENGMHRLSAPVKLWYHGPMFRYERPQAGRQRQFHQVGLELFGIEGPVADAEAIAMAIEYLKKLGLPDLSLEINSLGCPKCRTAYRDRLKEVISKNIDKFCENCQSRLDKNPLRILDCKVPQCQELLSDKEIQDVINSDFICKECSDHFEKLKEYLDAMGVKYSVNKLLVRGLDYYNRTVFEIKSNSLGSQNAVCGGGRYDALTELLGGQPTYSVGWAMGMERLLSLINYDVKDYLDVFVVSSSEKEAFLLAQYLREHGFKADFDMNCKNFKKQFEKASKLNAKYAFVLGEDEIRNSTVTVKNLATTEQKIIKRDDMLNFLNQV